MVSSKSERYALLKTLIDAHTMGINAAMALLKDCGYDVLISPPKIEDALNKIAVYSCQETIVEWIVENQIQHIGISYRLDPEDAVEIVGRLVALLKKESLYETDGALVKSVYFAGLKPACEKIDREYQGRIRTLKGGESAEESLRLMGVPDNKIPYFITEGCKYDKELIKFGKNVIQTGLYRKFKPFEPVIYPDYGTEQDSLVKRLDYNFKKGFQPLIRAHSGPYSAELTRKECLKQYNIWCRELAKAGYLDILSIGTSQLSQSNFGEKWYGKKNGGGVPVNSEFEYRDIWNNSRPMLVRTYSGTKDVRHMAEIYEKTINISWHALSLWWFDELDGRGPNSLYENLQEHISTIRYIACTGKPVETNVPHHFAFRGCDDVTYIVSAYLAAKMTKKCGVHTFVLQNMLNTPRSTWGVQDLAKSRALKKVIYTLQDSEFRIIMQTRAGLDYFKPDILDAKIQRAAVTAMMDDLDPYNHMSPEIIHVVSYCEALYLATPDILNDSIKITRTALRSYRELKKQGESPDVMTDDIIERTQQLVSDAQKIIRAMEDNIADLYSPEGLYLAFVAGWLPVPELWSESEEFRLAKSWETKIKNGGVVLVEKETIMPVETKINKCICNLPEAQYIFNSKYGRKFSCVISRDD